jgi:hypothetical protein
VSDKFSPLDNRKYIFRLSFREEEEENMSTRTRLLSVPLCFVMMLLTSTAANAQCKSGSNCQIILSGTGLPATPNPPCNPWGLWVWSQPSNNSYGNDGEGSMYFYAIHKAEAHVQASSVALSGSAVSETVSGAFPDGTAVSCTLAAHQTSPGKGILDSMSCTVGNNSCSVTDVPITVDISDAKN